MHQNSKCHVSSLDGWKCFEKNKAIELQFEENKEPELRVKEKQRQKNVAYMKKLIDVVRTLAKGGKTFRGHNEKEESDEKGLFLEVVQLLKKYDPEFKEYLETAPRNCTYLSNHVQNDILQALKNVILRSIRQEIEGQHISVIADETSDVSHYEQIAVVFRYIPKHSVLPVERFISIERLSHRC